MSKQATSKTETIRDFTQEIHDLQNTARKLKKQHKVLETKVRYRPESDELQAEIEAIVDAIAENDADIEAVLEEKQKHDTQLRKEQVKAERKRHLDEAKNYAFSVPNDDPLLACSMLAAIANQLQYEFVRMQGPYEGLSAKVYTRRAGEEDGPGAVAGTHADPNYEINRSDLDKLDQMRERRDFIMTLRFAVKRDFEAARSELPEDVPFIPQLLRQTDEERFASIEERQRDRWLAQVEERKAAGEVARTFGRQDLQVFGTEV